ncbi:FecR domain-containing protein [Pedobacter sp. PLR]|uniref:FecR family protein n=1 Tax=Pedobacter sp. PLR TaxID=2994465 RepID=UPI002246408F|nr:FecR family protein [Pedobacter sp. PLR]MCX2451434.1 FecR domain-containing protein [Pedobacter sp. PLR]
MQKEEVPNLLKKYLAGNCSEQERGMLETWYLKYEEAGFPELSQEKKDGQLEEIWAFLADKIDLPAAEDTEAVYHITPLWPKITAAAAMVLITLGIGFYFYNSPDKVSSVPNGKISHTTQTSKNKAMLTLADGRTIALDEASNGEIAKQAGVTITKTKDGLLVYEGRAKESAFNNIATPKGGQYQISLPDGTKVWLNAASSLNYPAAFTGDKRAVRLLGEAYFEVAKNKEMPFVVYTKGQEIEVLGTHFNVNAYEDEGQTKTTLLEGSVKVKLAKSAATALLKPGQQAVFEYDHLDVSAIDVAEVVAWKEGCFLFQDEDIRSIMRKVARWYDVDVAYEPHISSKKIGGRISRNKSLKVVLKTLSGTDKFNFKVEGRRVTVMP